MTHETIVKLLKSALTVALNPQFGPEITYFVNAQGKNKEQLVTEKENFHFTVLEPVFFTISRTHMAKSRFYITYQHTTMFADEMCHWKQV